MTTVTAHLHPVAAASATGPIGLPTLAEFHAAYQRELAQHADPASPSACLRAAALASRQLLAARWAVTQGDDARRAPSQRRVHYLSMEFLMGRALQNALSALGIEGDVAAAFGDRAPALADVLEQEPDAALGNGGLGRLAACFLDAFATLGLPSFGYGLRYEHGMFAQAIEAGRQVEHPDDWLRNGQPWELVRPELRYPVGFGGCVVDADGRRQWQPAETVIAQAVDFVVPGHGTERVSTLRQWQAQAPRSLDFATFCRGEHAASAAHRHDAEALNWVLYPDDSTAAGRRLRLKQEFLLVSASVQDLLARHLREGGAPADVGARNVLHLNDTHPALAPAELMRLLLDEHGLPWDEAWRTVRDATSYTNHTLMPEALETWDLALFGELLPRHLEIVFLINQRLLDEVRVLHPGDDALAARLSLIDEGSAERPGRRVRMAALAIAASHTVNGVSALHSRLMTQTIFADHARLWPERFTNVTNGVTPRRWLMQANPGLSALLDEAIGRGWRADLSQLQALAERDGDAPLLARLQAVKQANKQRLAAVIVQRTGIVVDPASLFDVQIKRIHEYKRQLLNLLQVIARWQAIADAPQLDWHPRTVIFAGKAASAYVRAKEIIRLIHDVAEVVNHDPRCRDRLKLVFLPNYGVSLAEAILPAADLSEQISTAGTEASGTGNMKFALNGALTIGTWDGANIEMAESVGVDHLFVFGQRAEGIAALRAQGYCPQDWINRDAVLQRVLAAIGNGTFSGGDTTRYQALLQSLTDEDRYFLMADFADYRAAQARVDALFRHPAAWQASALRNIAGMGPFSVDRTIGDYIRRVWAA
ncbi:glycogen/starch/alpha-glucan phosphorylase [Aquabacterium humicola]|uniref:glycogen/starch/alpha-glucan phosphorylase n=1 Tax=Aquabacterium humicola TaxID=3237377 RepID=UPI0025438BB8|nr:glycogen/starch/alpha-glucan phosphorylase [Rubrivivax pictus]